MENVERNNDIYETRMKGVSLSIIAKKHGISKERVRQIYLNEKRKRNRYAGSGYSRLYNAIAKAAEENGTSEQQTTRIMRCLLRAGIGQKIDAGEETFDNYVDTQLLSLRNFGMNALKVVRIANKYLLEDEE